MSTHYSFTTSPIFVDNQVKRIDKELSFVKENFGIEYKVLKFGKATIFTGYHSNLGGGFYEISSIFSDKSVSLVWINDEGGGDIIFADDWRE